MEPIDENAPVYIARCKCGCMGIVYAIVDNPEHRKHTAREVAFIIRGGYSIENATAGYVRKAGFGCQVINAKYKFKEPLDLK